MGEWFTSDKKVYNYYLAEALDSIVPIISVGYPICRQIKISSIPKSSNNSLKLIAGNTAILLKNDNITADTFLELSFLKSSYESNCCGYFQDGKFVALAGIEQTRDPIDGLDKYLPFSSKGKKCKGKFILRKDVLEAEHRTLPLKEILYKEMKNFYRDGNLDAYDITDFNKILQLKSLPQTHRDGIGELLE